MHRFAGANPAAWHSVGLLLHLLNCTLVFALARRLWPASNCAGVAALLFEIHGTRPEVVAWTAGGFDLLAACCVLSTALVFFSPLAQGIRWPLALTLLVLGILCKESAYVCPSLLLCLALASRRLNCGTRVFIGVAMLVCALLFAYRWSLFHGPGGYVDSVTGQSQILSIHLLPTLKALLLRIWVILCFPIDWQMRFSALAAIALGAGCISLAGISLSRVPPITTVALLASVILGVLPAIHLALIGDDAQSSRANGARSHGPVAAEGKQASAQNLRHGALAATILLQGESEERFLNLIAGYTREFNPITETEWTMLESMAVVRWRQMRIWAIERNEFNVEMQQHNDIESPSLRCALAFRHLADTPCTLDVRQRYETAYERQFTKALTKLLYHISIRTRPSPTRRPAPPPARSTNPSP